MRKLLSSLACSTLLFAATGCDNGTDAPGLDAWKSPDAGTVLVFRETRTRVMDGKTESNTGTFALDIIQSGIAKWGQQNVSIALGPDDDTLVFAVFDNGDFAIGDSNQNGITWDVYPTGSKQTITTKDIDSVTNGTDRDIWHVTRSYAGEEEVTIADKSIYAIKIIQQEMRHETSPGFWDYLTTAQDTIYFAPDFGFFVRQRGITQNFEFDSLTSKHTTALDLQAYIKE